MHRAPTGRNRTGGDGFVPVPQVDATEEVDYQEQSGEQPQRRWTVNQFRSRVQQAIRQSAIQPERDQPSVHSSPALSDTTLINGDYLDVPIHDYEEGDLSQYVEYVGYYGPEATKLSPSTSLKAGLGLEVHCDPVDYDLSPGGLQVDDARKDTSYHGSEGIVEEEAPTRPSNYKPAVLRIKFLFALFISLVILMGLAELAAHRLPDETQGFVSRQALKNATEVRLRSIIFNERVPLSLIRFHKRQNDTDSHGSEPETPATLSTSIGVHTTSATSENTVTAPVQTSTQDTTIVSSSQAETTSSQSTSTPTTVTIPTVDTTMSATKPVIEPSHTEPSTTTAPSTTTEPSPTEPSPSLPPLPSAPMPPPQSITSSAPTDPPVSIPEAGSTVPDTALPSTNTPETSHHDDQTTGTTTALPPPITSPTDVTIGLPTSDPPQPSPSTETSPHDDPPPPVLTIPSLTSPMVTFPTLTLPTIPNTDSISPRPTDPGSPQGTWQPGGPIITDSPGPDPPFTAPTGPPALPTAPGSSKPDVPPTLPTLPTFTFPTGTGGSGETGQPGWSTLPDNPQPNPPTLWPTGPSSWPANPSFPLPPGPGKTETNSPSTRPGIPGSTVAPPSGPTTTRVPSNPTSTSPKPPIATSTSIEQPPSNNIPSATDHDSRPSLPSQIESHTEALSPTSLSISATEHMTEVPSPSYSEPNDKQRPPSSTSVESNLENLQAGTYMEHTALPEPFTTITRAPDTEISSPPVTETIVTSMGNKGGLFIETTMTTVVHPIKAQVDDPVTDFVTTFTDSRGSPTLTQTISALASTQTMVYRDAEGHPTKTEVIVVLSQPRKTILTDYQGRATKTEDYYVAEATNILYDKFENPTATETSIISETAALTTLFNDKGSPTATRTILVPMSVTTTLVLTPTASAMQSSEEGQVVRIIPMSHGKYFAGLMLPTFIAIVLSIPIRMLDQTAKLYQPFHALSTFRGASASQSLCFQTTGLGSLLAGPRSLLSGQVLLSLTGLLVLMSVVLIPLSAEAIHIILQGPECTSAKGDTLTCMVTLGVNPGAVQATIALLAVMALLVGVTAAVLWKWKTGLKANPWNLFYMAHLSANHDIRLLLQRLREKNGHIKNSEVLKALARIPFVLAYWKDNGILKYSVLIANEPAHPLRKDKIVTFEKIARQKKNNNKEKKEKHAVPFFILTWRGRLLFLVLLCAVLIGIVTYNITGEGQGYNQEIFGKWSGIRFFFTGVAVVITLFWGSLFYAVAFISPHRLIRRNRLYKGKVLYMSPPSSPFSGLWSSLKHGRRDLYLAAVSATAILSEILPLFVGNILDKGIQNQLAHAVCTWMAVSVLCIMILTVCGSFFVDWPHMPIDPSTVAGAMYYVWDPKTHSSVASMSPSSGLLFGRVNASLV